MNTKALPAPLPASLDARPHGAVQALQEELRAMHVGRASAAMVERIVVDYYGARVPLAQVASIAVAGSAQLSITPWDRAVVPFAQRAIMAANLGLGVSVSAGVIHLVVPPLTRDRRKALERRVHDAGERAKVVARQQRRSVRAGLEGQRQAGAITPGAFDRAQLAVQALTDAQVQEIDRLVTEKRWQLGFR